MKILMLGWELPPHNSGGLGVACYHLSKALALEGASIDFVVPYTASHPDVEFMNVHAASQLDPLSRYGMTGAYDSQYVQQQDLSEAADDLRDMRSVQKRYVAFTEDFVQKNTPDTIHAHDWLTLEAGMRAKELTRAPLIVHIHATEFDRAGGALYGNPLVHEIEYQGLMMADRVIAVSNITKELLVRRYNIPADKIEVVYNTVDFENLNQQSDDFASYKYLETLKNEGYTVVTALTRFTVQKGLTHLLHAAARACQKYDKLAFLLAGDGEQRDELVRLSAELGIADKVLFTGFVRGQQWRGAYNIADIFVMSSVSEPFGLTALEAAHYNSALIITKQSGVGEILNNILRYDFWDVDALADQIVGIATSPSLASSLKQNIRHEYARLSWSDIARQCIQLYAKAGTGVRL